MAIAKRQAEAEADKAKAELMKSEIGRSIGSPTIQAMRSPRRSPGLVSSPGMGKANQGQGALFHAALSAAYAAAPPVASPPKAVAVPPVPKKIEDDDIWDEPPPEIKPGLPKGSTGLSKLMMPPPAGQSKAGAAEEDSSDDDKFWGMGGAKPTLGGGTATKPSTGGKSGGDALDDWLF